MEGISWVMYANMAVWLGIGGYLFFLGRKAVALEKRLRHLDFVREQNDSLRRQKEPE